MAARARLKLAVRFTSMIRDQSELSVSAELSSLMMPADATTPSSPPILPAASDTAVPSASSSVTSRRKHRSVETTPSRLASCSGDWTVPLTRAPCAAASFAVASPMPEPMPVMKRRLLTRDGIGDLLKTR